jgi:hypothetical protein
MDQSRGNNLMGSVRTMYLTTFKFDGEKCEFVLGDQNGYFECVSFSYVRCFVFVKESDYFSNIISYTKARLFEESDFQSRVFEISRNAILEKIITDEMRTEAPSYYLIWTPDECFEIVGFEPPQIFRIV